MSLIGGDSRIMKYLKTTNYAFHTMHFLAMDTKNKLIGVQELAERQNFLQRTCLKY